MNIRRERHRRRYTLDEIWLNFYATDAIEWRNRLLLHYFPLARFVAVRVIRQLRETKPDSIRFTKSPIALALIAVGRGIDSRPKGDLNEWNLEVVRLVTEAVTQHVGRP
jgi:hypothetical protein